MGEILLREGERCCAFNRTAPFFWRKQTIGASSTYNAPEERATVPSLRPTVTNLLNAYPHSPDYHENPP